MFKKTFTRALMTAILVAPLAANAAVTRDECDALKDVEASGVVMTDDQLSKYDECFPIEIGGGGDVENIVPLIAPIVGGVAGVAALAGLGSTGSTGATTGTN